MQKKLLICHLLYIILIIIILIYINKYYECNCKREEYFEDILTNDQIINIAAKNNLSREELIKLARKNFKSMPDIADIIIRMNGG